MANLVRMEDIIDIIGMNNYFKAIQLDHETLKYSKMEKKGKIVTLHFQYKTQNITIDIDKNLTISNFHCGCKDFRPNTYCPHIGLAIMRLMSGEAITQEVLDYFNSHYDEAFNNFLFEQLNPKTPKKRINMQIILRSGGNLHYELVLKIGLEKHAYVLKQKLEEFMENYDKPNYELVFGKNFTYSSKEQYFTEADQEILDFVRRYVESNSTNRNHYYYSKVTSIDVSGGLLNELLHLLRNREFQLELGYKTIKCQGISEYNSLKTDIETKNDMITVHFDYENCKPLTQDYSYLLCNNEKICHLNKEYSQFLKLLVANHKKQLYFKEAEYGKFANIVLPKLKKINEDLELPQELKEKFQAIENKLKFYFEKKKNTIIGEIKLDIDGKEINIFSDVEQINGKYIIRNQTQEKEYRQELENLNFIYQEDKKHFLLEKEDDLLFFLEEGLPKLTEKYEVYVSKNIKDIKVYPKGRVTSTFSIGRDNILSYQFSVDHIEAKELQNLLDAVKLKKKYYRLKNGNYMRIEEDKELENFNKLVEGLELTGKDLSASTVVLPKYKSIQVSNFKENENTEFIQMNSNLQDLISKFKKYKNLKVKLPEEDQKKLRDYQEIGVKWMMTVANCGFGGILADEMGLGKSFQSIVYIKLRLQQNKKAKFLIVVPTSLIYNWQNEFEKFAPDIPILLLHDIKSKRVEKFKEMKDYSVIVTSYGLLRQDLEEYEKIVFDTCIIDEAQNIKNVQTEITKAVKTVKSEVKFALTGTPIENSILELWSIFDYIMPGFLPNFTKFKREYSIKKIEEGEVLKNLNALISPFILRRKKMDVVKDLPAKLENTITIELEEEQKRLYVAQLQKTKEQIEETLEKDGFMKSQILILSLLTKLRQICIDPRLLVEEYQGESAKMKQLVEIVKGSTLNGHKMLVFSQFPSALQLVKQHFEREKITYYYLDGSTKAKERMRLVDAFNQDDTNVFLISLKAGGTGLNLTSADIVIHLDPWWNPQVENQATDRVHRIGQKNVVEVVKLVAKGTIEEKIVELQEKKKNLSDQVIEGENRDSIVLSKLTEKELRSLLDA